jgi:hypothetical protein
VRSNHALGGIVRVLRLGIVAAATTTMLAGCVSALDGNTSCADFLAANVADREDIVGGAMDQRGVHHDEMFDLTMVSMQVGSACQGVPGSTHVADVIAWNTWEPVMGK